MRAAPTWAGASKGGNKGGDFAVRGDFSAVLSGIFCCGHCDCHDATMLDSRARIEHGHAGRAHCIEQRGRLRFRDREDDLHRLIRRRERMRRVMRARMAEAFRTADHRRAQRAGLARFASFGSHSQTGRGDRK
ncbi:hypothetical protein [Paraburkholderia caballeronis]|uniref:hypothetical protein n=1 Tax=Paraburkholderia caballeronis TaxID=416943 RepID=UPI001064C456|nr:hypothetical protein [Paraburkholderia caballeronis]